jgi:nitrate/nitrite-specific signal transduction histidine kinase
MKFEEKESQVTRASLELLYHISRELTTALDLHEVLQRVLLISMQTVGAVNGSIIVLDEDLNPIESAIVVGDQYQEHTTQRLHETIERAWLMGFA